MSRITRTGLWLLPWLPAAFVAGLIWSRYDSSLFITHFQGPLPSRVVAFAIFSQMAFVAFVAGLIVLSIAGIRHLVRLKRHPPNQAMKRIATD